MFSKSCITHAAALAVGAVNECTHDTLCTLHSVRRSFTRYSKLTSQLRDFNAPLLLLRAQLPLQFELTVARGIQPICQRALRVRSGGTQPAERVAFWQSHVTQKLGKHRLGGDVEELLKRVSGAVRTAPRIDVGDDAVEHVAERVRSTPQVTEQVTRSVELRESLPLPPRSAHVWRCDRGVRVRARRFRSFNMKTRVFIGTHVVNECEHTMCSHILACDRRAPRNHTGRPRMPYKCGSFILYRHICCRS